MLRRAPFIRPPAKWAYARLPRWCRVGLSGPPDSPTSWLDTYFGDDPHVTFVQIGAYDGIELDLIRPLVLKYPGWQGALIEPMPSAFGRLKQNYSGQSDRLQFLNCAISNESGELVMYEVDEEEMRRSDLPWWAPQVASVSREHVMKHFPDIKVHERSVRALRLDDALRSLNMASVKLLAMDVEGHERYIMEDIDFDYLGIKVILYERKHMNYEEEQKVIGLLERAGFAVKLFGEDAIAYRE